MKCVKLILLTGCLAVASMSTAQKIGLLMDSYVTERWYSDQKFFADKIKDLGGECLVEVANSDAAEQVRLGKKLIAEGVNALVIVAVDGKKAIEIIQAATEAKIPVIAYDRLIHSKDLAFYISYNNVKVGRLQAQYAMKKVPAGNYILINGPASDNNSFLFKNGQMTVLQPAVNSGKIKIIGDFVLNGWSEIEAMMKMADFFSSSETRPDAIIATNDGLAFGTIQALPDDLRGKVVVTGQDADLTAVKNIIAGLQSMTIYKPIKPLAERGAEIAMKLARGEKVSGTIKLNNGDYQVESILLDPIVVDKTNYKDTVVKDGHVNLSGIDK